MKQAQPRRANRLATETSPYLLSHAGNPVDWYPWGTEALELAKSSDRPILLSIGYAACHWCHVMERESFENEKIAALMNQHFVCVKVDREERPDLDDIYMAATVALSGSGGWPMTVFLTPDQRPFFAGTYFPPEDRYGRPGLERLLSKIAEAWKEERSQLLQQANTLTAHVREQSRGGVSLSVGREAMASACEVLWQAFDRTHGGFGGAPKFPPAATLSFLLRYYRQAADLRALEMVVGTLNGMKNGGLYDHVGGGFARYSTDARWLVPHFEKMLYDNAQLSHIYLEAYLVTGRAEYARVANETLAYVMREMQGADGGYFSATDADSEGEEGKFFVWTPDQVNEVLDAPDAERFCAFYDITPEGNWEGRSVLNTPRSLAEVARELGIDVAELALTLERSRPLIYEARQHRAPPLLDDKIITAYNGLMLGAMAFGYQVLGEDAYLRSATRAAQYLWTRLRRSDGGLYRTARAGTAHLRAYLEDYAYLADGLVTLYEAGGDPRVLKNSLALAERILTDFADDAGGAFYFTAHDHEALIARTREGHDGALPNPNSIAAKALLRLGRHFGREYLSDRAAQAIRAYGGEIARLPRAFTSALSVVDLALEPPVEVATVGVEDDPLRQQLNAVVASSYMPNKVQAHVDPNDPESAELSPLTQGKQLVEGRAAVYICESFSCRAPVSDPEQLSELLQQAQRQRRESRRSELSFTRLEGFATAEATARLKTSKRPEPGLATSDYRELGDTGLYVSQVGFGAYRLTATNAAHAEALAYAIECGVNLIDTATTYTEGDSERVIGRTLARLTEQKLISRDQMVVVSKLGYAQGPTLRECQVKEQQGSGLREVVKVSDALWYCLHPEFLEQELDQSRARLGLETLDVCLLHNPEHFFEVNEPDATMAERQEEFYRRLEQAFAYLERAAQQGKLNVYGISSNTLAKAAGGALQIDLWRCLATAERAGGKAHRFKVIELPLNLHEPDAASSPNAGPDGAFSTIAFARSQQLGVLTNRPLHAFVGDALLRLVDPELDQAAPEAAAALEVLERSESEFAEQFAPNLSSPEGGLPATALFAWASKLRQIAPQLRSLAQFAELDRLVIGPRVQEAISSIDRAFGPSHPKWSRWRNDYLASMRQVRASLREQAAQMSAQALAKLRHRLDPFAPPYAKKAPFSQLALAFAQQVPGVSAVLVGMRNRAYVDDVLASLRLEPLLDIEAAMQALSAQSREEPAETRDQAADQGKVT